MFYHVVNFQSEIKPDHELASKKARIFSQGKKKSQSTFLYNSFSFTAATMTLSSNNLLFGHSILNQDSLQVEKQKTTLFKGIEFVLMPPS